MGLPASLFCRVDMFMIASHSPTALLSVREMRKLSHVGAQCALSVRASPALPVKCTIGCAYRPSWRANVPTGCDAVSAIESDDGRDDGRDQRPVDSRLPSAGTTYRERSLLLRPKRAYLAVSTHFFRLGAWSAKQVILCSSLPLFYLALLN